MSKNIEIVYKQDFSTPCGVMVALASDTHLLELTFGDSVLLEKTLQRRKVITAMNSILQETKRYLAAYFKKQFLDLKYPPYLLSGTPLQLATWSALADINLGTTITYKQMAHTVNRPTAYRAVGRIIGQNYFDIMLPCHRVIGTHNNLCGYAHGLTIKRWLLEHEDAT